jgi:hypothetical protein
MNAFDSRLKLIAAILVLGACGTQKNHVDAVIEFTEIPIAGSGSPDELRSIQGRVSGAKPGQKLVLFAHAGSWWVQPFTNQPFTTIQPDSTWRNWTHPGTAYAALLVDPEYQPPATTAALPQLGAPVEAVASVDGSKANKLPPTLAFSGYEWEVRNSSSNRAGSINTFDPANAWTDRDGRLHLKISGAPGRWRSGEVKLSRSLGYGTYRFAVHDVSQMEPSAVLSFFTRDDNGPIREMDIEVSQWGEPEEKNAQYVIQPYFVAANTARFQVPAGTVTHTITWEPGKVTFHSSRGASSQGQRLSEQVFTSGVPSPGNEKIRMNYYVYENKHSPLQHESEVIVDKFEFQP